MTATVSSPTCPSCGNWNVRIAYRASTIEGVAKDNFSGKCHPCKHEWSDQP